MRCDIKRKTEKNNENEFYFLKPSSPVGIIIFGASGNLTYKKLLPAIFNLYQKGLMPENFFVLGVARTTMNDEKFREHVKEAINIQNDEESLKSFLERFYYLSGDYESSETYGEIRNRLKVLEKLHNTCGNRIFYLAIPPNVFQPVVYRLGESGLARESKLKSSFARIIIEKPFGRDLESAKELERNLAKNFNETQIYRIDHYLGKETVQNIFMFRFANIIFEQVWNNKFIDHIQITVAEDIGLENRAGYFDKTGLLRDMFQNHILQMLAFIAMEPPASFDAERIRDEKVKLLRSIRPFPLNELYKWIVRGQYVSGKINGIIVPSYSDESGVAKNSRTETFVAMKLMIDNWRWNGVPFYLRAGKRMPKKISEIAIIFKRVPHSMFPNIPIEELEPNSLIINIQPDEGISLNIQVKHPGSRLKLETLSMEFKYEKVFSFKALDAYARLLLDCMMGDQTLFIRSDDVISSWELLTPVLKAWEAEPENEINGKVYSYEAGTWGPKEANWLIEKDNRKWCNI